MNAKAKECVLGAIVAVTYGVGPLFALPLYKAGVNPDSVLFFRYLFAVPVLGIMIKARGRSFKLRPSEIIPLIFIGLLASFSSLALPQSCNYMKVDTASTLLSIYPILVALIIAFVLGEKLTLQTIFCILLALGGIGLPYKNGGGAILNLTGILLAMAFALSYVIYIVDTDRPLLKNIAALRLAFYVLLLGTTLSLVRIDPGRSLRIVHDWYLWGNLAALVMFSTTISFLYTTLAVQYIGSTLTAILEVLGPSTTTFSEVTISDKSSTLRLCCGIILIILTVTFIIAGSNVTGRLVRSRELLPRLPLKEKNAKEPTSSQYHPMSRFIATFMF